MNANAKDTIRPTKKQRELLGFIEDFIAEHGYSPSYREIMAGLNYTSVATVALHVNSLISRGHLRKRDRSARSLEVVGETPEQQRVTVRQVAASEEKWLVTKVDFFFKAVEQQPAVAESDLDKLYVLIGALRVLGMEGAAQAYIARLTALKERIKNNETYVA